MLSTKRLETDYQIKGGILEREQNKQKEVVSKARKRERMVKSQSKNTPCTYPKEEPLLKRGSSSICAKNINTANLLCAIADSRLSY